MLILFISVDLDVHSQTSLIFLGQPSIQEIAQFISEFPWDGLLVIKLLIIGTILYCVGVGIGIIGTWE